MATTIRPRTPADLPGCADALKAVHALNGYPVLGVDNPIAFLQTDDVSWVAELEEEKDDGSSSRRIVGHITLTKASTADISAQLWWQLHPDDKTDIAVLGRLFVHPDGRGGGTASRLIEAAVEEARGRGQRLVMFALVPRALDAMRLYRKLGWVHYGSTVFRWGEGEEMAAECFASPFA
ncbi:Uu.00g105100.m01.CDS01 [Anthostomella pinea]|uniref:Uu.00g105100.m01.CDS01 n=1 Tax=Anthostomella pinea TaxID=933095 RepID=A0AAI8YDC6_9PEZI|nr:Uu.00g105100.m01.CDS01 [Anthostomella pinea]